MHTKNKPSEWERDDMRARKMERKNRFRERTKRSSDKLVIARKMIAWRNDLPIIVHNRARRSQSDVTLKKRSDPESSPDGNAPLREESLMVFKLLSHIARDVTCGELRFPTG